FPPPALDYSREQDDLCMAALFRAAAYVLSPPRCPVVLDGRTFLRAYQVRDLLDLADTVGQPPNVIECVCADEVVRRRLAHDRPTGPHPAGTRAFASYVALKGAAEPPELPRLALDTGRLSPEECLDRALASLRAERP